MREKQRATNAYSLFGGLELPPTAIPKKATVPRPLVGIALKSHENARSPDAFPFLQEGTDEYQKALEFYTTQKFPKPLQSLAYNAFRSYKGKRIEFSIKQRELGNVSIPNNAANKASLQQKLRELFLAHLPDVQRRLLLWHTHHQPYKSALKQWFKDHSWPEGLEWDDEVEKEATEAWRKSPEGRRELLDHRAVTQKKSDERAGGKDVRKKRNLELADKAQTKTPDSKRAKKETKEEDEWEELSEPEEEKPRARGKGRKREDSDSDADDEDCKEDDKDCKE